MCKLIGNQRWDGVPDMPVHLRQPSRDELVIARKALKNRHLTDRAQAILFGMGIPSVSNMATFPFNRDSRPVPPEAAIDIRVRSEILSLDVTEHGRGEETIYSC